MKQTNKPKIIAIIPFLTNAQIDSSEVVESISFKNDSLYQKGYKAAEQNYKGYKTISTFTFAISSTLLGLGPLVAGGSYLASPNLKKIEDPMLENPKYYNGYFDKAKSIRRKKIVKNYLIGTGVCVGLYATLGLIIIANGNFLK